MDRRWIRWMLGIAACEGASNDADSDANLMSASESGASESGGDVPVGCVYTPTVLANVDAIGVTGLSASDVLAEAEGTFVGGIAWTDEMPLNYLGSTDPSALTLTVSHDGGEIRSVSAELMDCTQLNGCACEDRLEVDVTFRLASADGVLDETWSVVLVHEPTSWFMRKPIGLRHEFQADDTTGSLSTASFSAETELQRLDAQVTFRNGSAEGSIDYLVLWNEWAGGGSGATFGGLRDGVTDVGCHELQAEAACAHAGCEPVIGYQQILDCQCAFEDTFCFATAPEPDAALAFYTHPAGGPSDPYEEVIALPSFGDVTPAPWTACVDAPEVPGCECATEGLSCE